MKYFTIFIVCSFLSFSIFTFGQTNFNPDDYQKFLETHANIDATGLQDLHPIKDSYVKNFEKPLNIADYNFLDSIIVKYDLTDGELNLLNQNRFMVTERISRLTYGSVLWDIYRKDLPVMITTDLILHALHKSYDSILKSLELNIMNANLLEFLSAMYNDFPIMRDQYKEETVQKSIEDLDLYITVAYSLITGEKQAAQYTTQERVDKILQFIDDEEFAKISLFSDTPLDVDFSQFKPRSHYTGSKTLQQYFRTMMWLGRISMFLTPPPNTYISDKDILRANTNAYILNELMELSRKKALLEQNDLIINKLVGESDNITPVEYDALLQKLNIQSLSDLHQNFDRYYEALQNDEDFTSRIASFPYIANPPETGPAQLPISYKLSGQRFIIDSYVFSNVVHDRVGYRMQPDPLDALICLGNNDAINLMKPEIDQYNYAINLAGTRYLIEHQHPNYWTNSFYGSWLDGIRILGQQQDEVNWNKENLPPFMTTVAWQQEKINTQLAAWTQLRHDNLLYAAQSYTGGIICCFPHSYVEPYPAFYGSLEGFAQRTATFFEESDLPGSNRIVNYFTTFGDIVGQLKILAEKELRQEAFTEADNAFLYGMLHEGGICGVTLTGWATDLYYLGEDDLLVMDMITADVHTQPTDEVGNVVGKVKHVANGPVDIGVFLAPSPSNDYKPMAYVGAVSSFYEYVNNDFNRTNDEEWTERVVAEDLPERPDWVNIYLADDEGKARAKGRELPVLEVNTELPSATLNIDQQLAIEIFPNPAIDDIKVVMPSTKTGITYLKITDVSGKEIITYSLAANASQVSVNTFDVQHLDAGLYNFIVYFDDHQVTKQVLIVD